MEDRLAIAEAQARQAQEEGNTHDIANIFRGWGFRRIGEKIDEGNVSQAIDNRVAGTGRGGAGREGRLSAATDVIMEARYGKKGSAGKWNEMNQELRELASASGARMRHNPPFFIAQAVGGSIFRLTGSALF